MRTPDGSFAGLDGVLVTRLDGSEKLRYPVGHEAAPLLETCRTTGDVEFKKMMATQLGI